MKAVDIKLSKQGEKFDINWTEDGDFEMTDNYETAVAMSIFGERRAKSYEVALPQYRRGWIGNLLYENPDDENGSGVWLFEQQRLTSRTLNGIRDEIEKSLLWMVGEIVEQVEVRATPQNGKAQISIKLFNSGSAVYEDEFTF